LGQQAAPNPAPAASIKAGSDSYVALRQGLSNTNKDLASSVQYQKVLERRNAELLKEALVLNAANKKLVAEKQRLTELSADLERQRAQLAASLPDAQQPGKE
jgi:recombinational DNA repair ATPase RecF